MSTRIRPTISSSSVVTQQMLIEHEMLRHVVASLRTVIGWNPPEAGATRRLDSLRFIVGSLHRHLERLMSLEEQDGYMPHMARRQPHLTEKVNRLRQQHDLFRKELREFHEELERLPSDDSPLCSQLCDRLSTFSEKLETHSSEEVRLVQEAFLRDEGGEG